MKKLLTFVLFIFLTASCELGSQAELTECGLLDWKGEVSVRIVGEKTVKFTPSNCGLLFYRTQNPESRFSLADCGDGDPMSSDFAFSVDQLTDGINGWKILSTVGRNKSISFRVNEKQLTRTDTGISGNLTGKAVRYYWDRNYEDSVQYEIRIDIDR
jgi:hypothetical protein